MENTKKAIILDMDETLEHGISLSSYDIGNEYIMVLRPYLDELIIKLKQAKEQEIDIILCTTARDIWVNRFLALKPEFKDLFDKKYTRDNEEEWRNYSKETNPLEYDARNQNINLEYSKPVTTFGYDSILFIDDSKIESVRLQILFELTQGKLKKDVTLFTGFGFNGGKVAWNKIISYKKASSQNQELSEKLKEYIELERNNIGCLLMCSAIDRFINKEFKAGLTLVDEVYIEEYNVFDRKISLLQEQLEKVSLEMNNQLFNCEEDDLKQILNADKKYVYEGIEI